MTRYPWRGNIRELRNFCENIAVMHSGETIEPESLDAKFTAPELPAARADCAVFRGASSASDKFENIPESKKFSKRENEFRLIEEALNSAGGNKTKAAELLGISRRTLHRKIAEMDGGGDK